MTTLTAATEGGGGGVGVGWDELERLLRTLEKSSNRLNSLDSIREVIKTNGGLPDAPLRTRLIHAASSCSTDPNSRIASKWLQHPGRAEQVKEKRHSGAILMADLVAQFGEAMILDLDVLLPMCIEAMGSPSASVRQASVQTMTGCGKVRDHDVRVVLRGIAECILHSPSEEQRAECCAALVTVYSNAKYRNVVAEAQALQEVVVPALAPALSDASAAVARSAGQAWEGVRARAPDALQAAIDQLPNDLQRAVKAKLSAPGGKAGAVDLSINQEESGGLGAGYEGTYVTEEPERTASTGEGQASGAVASLPLVPARLLAELQDANNWRVRALAVEELQTIVKNVRDAQEMRPNLPQLMEFLMALLHDPNFKIEITALQTMGDLVSLVGPDMRSYYRTLMPQLQQKMGDNKTLVRQANAKVVVKMMHALGPDEILRTLLSDLSHDSWRVREEILTLTMLALLSFAQQRLDLDVVLDAVTPLLDDEKTKVKLTAIETMALLHSVMGVERFHAQLGPLDGQVRRLLQVRLTQPQLPTLNADGLLELPAVRGQGLDEQAPSPRGDSRLGGERGGGGDVQEPSHSPMRRERPRVLIDSGETGERDSSPSNFFNGRMGTASPSRRADRNPTSPTRTAGANIMAEMTDSPRVSPRVQAHVARRGSQSGPSLEVELNTLMHDDQPLYSEITVDDRSSAQSSRGSSTATAPAAGMLRSPRKNGTGTPRAGGGLEQVPENEYSADTSEASSADTRNRRPHIASDKGADSRSWGSEDGALTGTVVGVGDKPLDKPLKKPIKPFWMDGLRSGASSPGLTSVAGGPGRDAVDLGSGGAGTVGLGGGGMAGADPLLGVDSFNRAGTGAGGGVGPRMRPPSAGRRAAPAAPAFGVSGLAGDSGAGVHQAAQGQEPALGHSGLMLRDLGGVWANADEGDRFASLPGISVDSPMVCSPPMSPQSVRACVSPNERVRPFARPAGGHQVPAQADHFGGRYKQSSGYKDNSRGGTWDAGVDMPPLEKAFSDNDMSRHGSTSVPTRTAGSMSAGLGDDLVVSLSQEKIASRLSIIKTRRGRTSSSRRGPNSMSAPADESGGFGLGDTRPGSSIFSAASMGDLGSDTPMSVESESGGDSRQRHHGRTEGGKPAYRPSQSAPTSVAKEKRGGFVDIDEFQRIQQERERRLAESMEVEGAPPGAHRSVIDISAKPIELMPTEDLRPADNPEGVMKSLVSKLGASDWAVQMDALNNLRALAVYHASATIIPQLHAVIRAVLLVVDNLRSNLSKSALMSLTDMFKYLKTAMDPELDHVVIVCVKKCADTAGFIADEAKRSLHAMIDHCTEQRTISALIHANANKNPLIRGKVASFVCAMIESMGPRLCGTRELERLFPLVVHYLSEGNAEPRSAGKRAIMELHRHNATSGDFDRLLRRCADADVRVVEKLLAQEHAFHNGAFAVTANSHLRGGALGSTLPRSTSHGANGTEDRVDTGKPPRGRRSTMATSRGGAGDDDERLHASSTVRAGELDFGVSGEGAETKARNSASSRTSIRGSGRGATLGSGGGADVSSTKTWLESAGEIGQRLLMIQNNIASSDFRNRYEAVSELTELLLKDKQTCLPKANYFVDLYVGRLADNNSKVAAAALQGVDKLVASYGSALESSLGLLALAANLSNTSPQLRSLASGVMESLCSRLDAGALVQPLAAAVDFGNQRAKAALLDKMRGLVSKVVDKKPQLLHKFFVASAVKSLDDHKADVRGANNLLIKELYTVLGDSILSGNPRLPERQLTRLKEVIASQTPAQPSLAGLSIH